MSSTIRKRLLTGFVALTALALLLLHFRQRNSYRCQVCFSKRDVTQWRVGFWMGTSVPLTPSWQRVTDTHFLQDHLSTNHLHVWKFAQGSPYYFFGTTWGGCAIGGGRYISDFCWMYE